MMVRKFRLDDLSIDRQARMANRIHIRHSNCHIAKNPRRTTYILAGFFSIFAQLSRRVTDRLKTNLVDEES